MYQAANLNRWPETQGFKPATVRDLNHGEESAATVDMIHGVGDPPYGANAPGYEWLNGE